ncbi:hypothetical protein [Mesobacillus foraminis]|uniref:hypothetical protein n=1 Tax=Mesobacillus foraminis TaxID=279826 RepID=UPI001045ADD7|nr:hypothetical protein [Mesobacillus foraminis]
MTNRTLLIGVEGVKTPSGSAGQVKPRRSSSDEEAYRPLRGKQNAWNGSQQPIYTTRQNKKRL